MYARVAQIKGFAAMAPPEEQRPGILCEYAHAMGNRCDAIELAQWTQSTA